MTEQSDYERGKYEAITASTLKAHADRLDRINGSMERVADNMAAITKENREGLQQILEAQHLVTLAYTAEMHELSLTLTSIQNQMNSDAIVRVQTAQALKEYTENERTKSDRRFVPVSRTAVIVGICGGATALIIALVNFVSIHG